MEEPDNKPKSYVFVDRDTVIADPEFLTALRKELQEARRESQLLETQLRSVKGEAGVTTRELLTHVDKHIKKIGEMFNLRD